MVSDYVHSSSEKIGQPASEWWKMDPANDIPIDSFQNHSEVDPSILEPKFDDEIIQFSRLDEVEFVVDMGKEEELKDY
jgi:hypothetical protein